MATTYIVRFRIGGIVFDSAAISIDDAIPTAEKLKAFGIQDVRIINTILL